jgi:hypothetical protein
MHAVVSGAQPVDPGDHFFSALSVGPSAVLRTFAPFILEAGASAWLTLDQPSFDVAGERSYQVHRFSIVAYFGAGWTSD